MEFIQTKDSKSLLGVVGSANGHKRMLLLDGKESSNRYNILVIANNNHCGMRAQQADQDT